MTFLRRKVIGPRVVTVLSDRHKSILIIFNEPNLGWSVQDGQCKHRYCSRHVCQNFTTQFGNKKLTSTISF